MTRKTVVRQGLRFDVSEKCIPDRPLYHAFMCVNPDGSISRFGSSDSLLDWISEGYVKSRTKISA